MAAFDPASARTSLFGALLDARDRYGRGRRAVEDPERRPLTYQTLVLAAFVLGRRLAALTRPRERVGVLLPNVNGFAAVLFGLNAFGRVPALLNYTAGPRNLSAACEIAGIETLVTSRRFVEQGKLDEVVTAIAEGRRVVWLEDVRAELTSLNKLRGLADAWTARRVHARAGVSPDDPAVILFTSGSEGLPKAVVLSNANLVANAYQIAAHADGALTPADIVFNPLPVFHSFGLTAGLLVGLCGGMPVVLYPSPLHYRQVPKLIAATKATVLFATDTFLQGYARAADPDDLASVRVVIAGAERVKDETRRLWQRTGAAILEGYGATECSPVIACNLPQANRPGSVGPMLPGIEHRLEAVEGIHEGGRLFVRGPNVMQGILDPDDPSRIVPPADGWHDTGDIVTVEDGFVFIRGRAKRFAKIAGEMVSLAAVEAMIQGLWPEATHVVVSLPDPRKGEQLALVTDHAAADREALQAHARAQGFPELWMPKAVLVHLVPVLGSGKVDVPAATEMARRLRPML
ncbi:MAG TPA: AMP-binding protein [Beijerinckiaceae bacterium]|jgi:acyl-[acyl-carrier-protein]-phospholipid O-acyltransferase/long-chain-fatty-acid--[acyl-carrier-protein] ligase